MALGDSYKYPNHPIAYTCVVFYILLTGGIQTSNLVDGVDRGKS